MDQLYKETLTRQIRSELAREIHDELGSTLAVLTARIRVAKLKYNQGEQIERASLEAVEHAAETLLKSTKDFIWTVGSSDDNPENIYLYLRDLGEELFGDQEIDYRARMISKNASPIQLSIDQSYQIILIYKEAFTNILKHSGATKVRFKFILTDDAVAISLSDNGVGFDRKIKSIDSARSYGLKNMELRAEKVGGTLRMTSKLTKGTSIKFSLPDEHFMSSGKQSNNYLALQAS